MRRYEDRGLVSEGGMGEVRRAWDAHLGREIVRKHLLWDLVGDTGMVRRFHEEIAITARLQHPGIPTLLDAGVEAGRPWFTLREIRGRTFAEVVATPPPDLAAIRRRVSGLLQAAEAVAYAHSVGVIHRDLKPSNVMIGEFGEVQVIDWGVARWVVAGADVLVGLPRASGGHATSPGEVVGTAGFMAPEQAAGGEVGPAADVYALGGLLRLAVGTGAPEILMGVADAACALDPAARPSAAEFARHLADWLDGTRSLFEADAMVGRARGKEAELLDLLARADVLRTQAELHLSRAPATDPASPEKEAAWAAEEEAARWEGHATAAAAEVETVALAALSLVAHHPEAHDLLADHHRREVERAERAGNRALAAVAEARLARHDRGRHAAFLRGDGWVSIETDQPASVRARPLLVERRRLVPGSARDLGVAPLVDARLPRGSWLLELTAGEVVTRYPVFLGREERWAPPEGVRGVVQLAPTLEPEERYVPAGWFRAGGDPGAGDAVSARRLWIEGFVARVSPVTNGEFRRFLLALYGEGRGIAELVPRLAGAGEAGGVPAWAALDGLPPSAALGPEWGDDRPVAQITWRAATAYAAWEAARTGLPWRLPHALEREKMARGVDGRRWPWGDHDDPTWSCTLRAHPGPPGRAPVSSWPTDESVYGIRGLAGNVRDFCRNAWERQPAWPDGGAVDCTAGPVPGPLCEVRGGAWSAEAHFCRPAARFANAPTDRFGSGGFRLVRSVSG